MVRCSVLLLLVLYFNAGANKIVDIIAELKMSFRELSIQLIAWLSVPDEPRDFYEKFATCSEFGIAPLQECEGSAADARIL